MILGIGIDQCEVRRMQRQLDPPANGFVTSVFQPAEIAYCNGKHHPAQHFAARFAAKEAALKALAAAGGKGSFWLDMEVINAAGRATPGSSWADAWASWPARLGVRTIHLSLTHTADLAAAVVVVED